jgi:uncharacterized membrane-anchored protein YitT (DUF2179 family)
VDRKSWFLSLLQLAVANIVLATGTSFFLAPLNIVNGGLSGIAIIFKALWGWDLDVTTAIFAWLLFLLGYVTLGKSFSLKTLFATISYPLFVVIFIRFIGIDALAFEASNDIHRLLASLFGGALVGFGVALAFLAGGSTGGVDVLVLLGKKWFDWTTSATAFWVDVLIIGIGFLVFGVYQGLFGIISTVMSSLVIELVFVGGSKMYWVTIISHQTKPILDYIHHQLERGSTLLPAIGGYTDEPYQVIQVAIARHDYYALKQAVSSLDPKAFVIFTQARSIHGEGFDPFPVSPLPKRRKVKS